MIDKNDPQFDKNGKIVPLLTNKLFKNQIEKDCQGFEN